jgi:diamine N-acetyltransferase
MVTLKGEHIYLRALEPEDLEFVHAVENDERFWEVSSTLMPYSRFIIQQYLENAHKDIYEAKQMRLVISDYDHMPLGLIDIFDFDFSNRRAGLGILIKDHRDREQGYGSEALNLLIQYCFNHLHLHQLYCNVAEDNIPSIKLFQNSGFKKIGLKKDWNLVDGIYKNEYFLQLVNSHVH